MIIVWTMIKVDQLQALYDYVLLIFIQRKYEFV